MKSPEVSIIVPVYKVEDYLERCVKSILAQTYTDFELILVDDGSPDRCGEMCDVFAKEDPRIRVIHKENGGLSDARNVGMDVAIGKYLIFIDSDELYEKNIIENKKDYEYSVSNKYNNNLDKSTIVNSCFKEFNIEDMDDYAVISSNADKVRDNTYTWVLDNENDSIDITFSKNIKYVEPTRKSSGTFKIVCFIILIVLSIITYFLYKKKNNSDI